MLNDSKDIDYLRLSINELQKKLKHFFSMLNEDELGEEESEKLRDQIENLQTDINDKQTTLKKLYKELTTTQKETSNRYNFD